MTSTETIRTALAGLWDAGACAYELAQAVMQAADIESADLELEVESVISRALLAREFVDLSKVAEEVAKVLPRLPLCEAILSEMPDMERLYLDPPLVRATIRKQFAALPVEAVRMALKAGYVQRGPHGTFDFDEEAAAQAVLRLLRGEVA